MKRSRTIIKYIAIVFFCCLVVLVIFPLRRSKSIPKAKADSLNAYPSVCLGGWQNPGNAAGESDVQAGSDSFSSDNSAVLDQTQAQIFCGSFQSSDQSHAPSSVTLHFSWKVVFPDQAATSTLSTSTDADSAAWSSVLDVNNTPTSTSLPTSSDDTNATDASSSVQATPSESSIAATTTDENASGDTNTSSSASTPQDNATTSPVLPPPDQSTSNQSSTSFLEKILQDPFSLLVSKTFADSTTNTANNFLDVSYSVNGTVWQDLGQVSGTGWQNYSVTIPVSSWDDINKLQIQLNPLLTVNPPTIYLDSMWIEVNYNQSLGGILQEGANVAIDMMSGLSDAVNGAVDSATNALTSILPSDTSNVGPQSSASTTAQTANQPPASPPAPTHRHAFQVNGTLPENVRGPQWLPPGSVKSYNASVAANNGATPTVTLADKNTIHISGTCSSYYYTILLFRNQTDYTINPAAAVFNEAIPCTNGGFDQTISDTDFPPQLATGTYYLMIANQGQTGPWIPYSVLYPISITNEPLSK